jgi:hypothetical protein
LRESTEKRKKRRRTKKKKKKKKRGEGEAHRWRREFDRQLESATAGQKKVDTESK